MYFDGYTETSLSGGTTTTTKYYSINGQRLAEKVNGTLTYLVTDLLSNVVMAINASGTVVAVELYEPYGTMNYTWGTMPTSHNYTDQRLDSQSGLLYYNFRWYDPVLGQFVRTDTKQNNANGMDPYAYMSDNPETKNDPTGHWGWGTIALIAVIVVVVVVVAVVAAPVLIAAAGATAEVAADGAVVGGVAEGTADVAGAATAEATATTAADATIDAAADTAADAVGDTVGDASADASADTSADASSDAGNEGNGCDALSFRASTLVGTVQGEHPISTLQVGEKVWSYNPQAKKMEVEPIQKVWLNHDNDLVDLTLIATVKDAQGKTSEQKEVVHTNEKHPFLTKEKGFIPVSQLKPGMHVLEADGSYGVVSTLVVVPGAMWMYNLTVAQDHTYVVGIAQWVVHNTGGSPCGGGDSSLDGLGKLKNQVIKVTQDGIDAVKQHLSQFLQDDGSMYPQNASSINRLQQAYDAGNDISGGDASFYTHELFEKSLMDQGADYATAHSVALAEYGVSPFSVYPPEVIQELPDWFNDGWRLFWGISADE